MTNLKRRSVLKSTLGVGILGIAASAGLLSPQSVLAAWPTSAFKAKKINDAVKSTMGSASMADSDKVKIKAPPIAENGAEVGVTISSSLPNIDSMSILVKKNASPMVGNFVLKGADPFIRTRIKIAETSDIVAVVRSSGKLFMAKRVVKVTIGGCGIAE